MKRAIVVLTIVFAACGGSSGWDEQARTDFVAGCTDGGGTQEMCECVQEKVEARYPDMDEDDTLSQDVVKDFAEECA